MSCRPGSDSLFSPLHVPDIQAEVISRGLAASISDMTIWRWLEEDAVKPWTHRSWIFPRDPDFEAKAARVLDLYVRQLEGQQLKSDELRTHARPASGAPSCRRPLGGSGYEPGSKSSHGRHNAQQPRNSSKS